MMLIPSDAQSDSMTKIFLSYANENLDQARQLYEALKAVRGIEVWFDKESLMPGMRWRPAIRKAIREANYFLALFSRQSNSRKSFIHKEMRQALEMLDEFPDEQTFVIPVRLDDCEPAIDELRDIQHVDLFPDWRPGLDRLLSVVKPSEESGEGTANTVSQDYEYRCAVIDLDNGLVNLAQVCQRLNSIQRFFHFTHPPVTSKFDVINLFDGAPNFTVTSVPLSFFEQRQYLNADLVACLTRYPLAFEGDELIEYNYFSGPSEVDETFMFMSTHLLYDFARHAGRTFESAIIYVILGQLLNYFTKVGYHQSTRACLMDFCELRSDMVVGLKQMGLCPQCLSRVENERLKDAIQAILADGMRL
jgi:hypothetical protein